MADGSKLRQIARRYVAAVHGLLKDAENDHFAQECLEFVKATKETPEIHDFLENPLVGREQKAEILINAFPMAAKSDVVRNFLTLICLKKREAILPTFCEAFRERVLAATGKAPCTITFARAPGREIVETVRHAVASRVKKDLVIETRIDPSILGGFRAEVNGKTIDATLRSQLSGMKKQMVDAVR